jgi:hypothetical protein
MRYVPFVGEHPKRLRDLTVYRDSLSGLFLALGYETFFLSQ